MEGLVVSLMARFVSASAALSSGVEYSRLAETVTGTGDDDDTTLERDLAALGGREVGHFERYVCRTTRLCCEGVCKRMHSQDGTRWER